MNIEIQDMDSPTMLRALECVHKYTGIRMNETKKTLLQGRLRIRMKVLCLNSYAEYLDYLENNKCEVQDFINSVTTNETYFFRTQKVWDFFQNTFLPEWFKDNEGKALKIWSAAASTGEEAHTIAICCEEFKLKNNKFDYEIHTSDIDTSVLACGESNVFTNKSVDNMRKNYSSYFLKYIIASGENFKTVDHIHNKIKFYQHDLFKTPKHSEYFDIVFIRNVLIYFELKDQEKVLKNIATSMKLNSVLVIGESESLSSIKTCFEFFSPLIYKTKK